MNKPCHQLMLCSWAVFFCVTVGYAETASFGLLHALSNPSTNAGAQQGYSVAVNGDIAVVGARYDEVGGTSSGVVNVYNAITGALLHSLTNPSVASDDRFGMSVAVSGTRVVVAASSDDTGAKNAGTVYVYDLANAMPTVPSVILNNPNLTLIQGFGSSVAISMPHLVVGVQLDDTGANNAGSAYVYNLTNVTPTIPLLILHNPSPASDDRFGNSVAISGTRIVVGARWDDAAANNAGSAYVYDLASETPLLPVVILTNPSQESLGYFGYSVGISGARVVVGAPGNDAGAFNAGSTYVYDIASATPDVSLYALNNPSPEPYDDFGYSVSISGTRILVGAFGDNTGASVAGSAYVYDTSSATPFSPFAVLNNPNPVVGDGFGYVVAIDGDTIVVGAPDVDTATPDRGIAYVFSGKPRLSLVPAAPGFAAISWTPTIPFDYVLQYADILSPTNWFTAPSGMLNPVTVPLTNIARFYRLVQP